MSLSIRHDCSHCGERELVPVGMAYTCPTCTAAPSQPCQDMRYADRRPIKTLHAARHELADIGVARAHDAVVRTLRAVS